MSLVRSIATIGALTSVSRVFGFARDVLIAAFLGAGVVADAFFVALRLPNLLRALFAEGAFSAAFVPLFVSTLERDGAPEARRFAEDTLAVLLTGVAFLVLAAQIAMPWVMVAIAPGFVGTEAFDLAVTYARLTFPYLLFISLAALLGGILNAHERFAAPAATPILLNLTLITALLGAGAGATDLGMALSWSVSAAGVLQFLWLFINCTRVGSGLRLRWPRLVPGVRLLLKRALPVMFGAGIYQVNVLVGTVLASLLPAGSVSYLFYADRLNQLPLGIVAAAVGTALLPVLSRHLENGASEEAIASQNQALVFALLLMAPAAAALLVLADPLISVLFERGAFGPEAVTATAAALMAYAPSLPAYLLVKAFTPGFYARHDTVTPVKIAAVTAVFNVVLSIVLMQVLAHVGIALASSLAAWLNALLLGFVLWRRGHYAPNAPFRRRVPRTLACTAVMTVALVVLKPSEALWSASSFSLRAAMVAGLIGAGLAVYGLSVHLSGAASFSELLALLRRRKTA